MLSLSWLRRSCDNRRISRLQFEHKGVNVQVDPPFQCAAREHLWIGDHVYIGPYAYISAIGGVRIGSGTIIGPKVTIFSANHRYEDAGAVPYDDVVIPLQVTIDEHVWIGGNVTIVPGVTIGEGCVVGAGTVVTSSFPACSVIGGNPARVLKMRDMEHYLRLKHEGKTYLKMKTAGLMTPHFDK